MDSQQQPTANTHQGSVSPCEEPPATMATTSKMEENNTAEENAQETAILTCKTKSQDNDDKNKNKDNNNNKLNATFASLFEDDGTFVELFYIQVFERNFHVKCLELTDCNLDEDSFLNLYATLRESKVLEEFNTSGCFSDEELYEVTQAICANGIIESVGIFGGWRSSTQAPIDPLLDLLLYSKSSLKKIKYNVCPSSSGIAAIFRSLAKNQYLTNFQLGFEKTCKVLARDWDAIFSCLRVNKVLQQLILDGNNFPLRSDGAVKKLLWQIDFCQNLRSFQCDNSPEAFLFDYELEEYALANRFVTELNLAVLMKRDRERFFQALREHQLQTTSRRRLSLSACDRDLNKRELSCLIWVIPEMTTVTSLYFRAADNAWDPLTHKQLMQALDQNRSLEQVGFGKASAEADYYTYRNRFRKHLEPLPTVTNATAGTPKHQLPAVNLWPRILYKIGRNKEDGKSVLFWALRSFFCQSGFCAHNQTAAASGRKRPRSDDDAQPEEGGKLLVDAGN